MDLKLSGRVAIVTGGGRGIGQAICLSLARENVSVVCFTQHKETLKETMEKMAGVSGEGDHFGLCLDISDSKAVADAVKQVGTLYKKIDIVINNAGISHHPSLIFKLEETEWDRVIDVNLKGIFNVLKYTTKWVMKSDQGRILNVSSALGQLGAAGTVAYCASKSGIVGLTKSVAKELARRGVCCNAIAPGLVETDINKKMSGSMREVLESQILFKRLGTVDEVASLALFLVSAQSSYITGQIINIDGGLE
ncbi:3-oxoacyl-ACP reductase FabG [bacterium]|jgi:3-oxoacyl-[acyl-carrier protein] reductase|nr:3-oxoacyl-ACP reductase FabG [bacterium]